MTKSEDAVHVPSLVVTMLIFVALMGFVVFSFFHYQVTSKETTGIAVQDIKLGDATSANDPEVWKLIYVADDTCDRDCKNVMYTLEQVKKALGDNRHRVDLAQLVPASEAGGVTSLAHAIYLVDPSGKVFDRYADNKDPMKILKDLKHVLDVSTVG